MHDSDAAPTLADPIRAGQKTSVPGQKTSAPAQKTASPAAAQGRAGRKSSVQNTASSAAAQGRAGRKTPAQNTAPLAAAKGQTGRKTPARSTAGENLRGETRGVRNRAIQESYGAKPAVKRAKPRRNAAGTEAREKDTAANSARDVAAANSVQNDAAANSVRNVAAANSAARKKAGASVTGGSSRARKRAADNITAARFAAVIDDKNRIYDPVLQKYCETHGMGLLRYTDAENCHFALIDKPALFVVYPGCDSLLCCDTDSASEAADLLAAYFRIPDREAARALFEQIQSMAPARPAK